MSSTSELASTPTDAPAIKSPDLKVPIPLNDNVAHALAGAGGGIVSMILTYGLDLSSLDALPSKRLTRN